MNMRIENGYFYMPTIDGEITFRIDEQDSVTITSDLIVEPKLSNRYIIQDGKFIKDKDGDWYCQIIYYNNVDKKFWEFWKQDKQINRITMSKRRV